MLCCALQADGVGALLHDSLRAFLKSNSHSLKRHVWSTAGSPAALEAWTGTTATIQVGARVGGRVLSPVVHWQWMCVHGVKFAQQEERRPRPSTLWFAMSEGLLSDIGGMPCQPQVRAFAPVLALPGVCAQATRANQVPHEFLVRQAQLQALSTGSNMCMLTSFHQTHDCRLLRCRL
jgi:hypothetical protein